MLMRDRTNPSHTALGRYDATKQAIVALRMPREGVMGVRPAQQGAELRHRSACSTSRFAW